MRRCEPVEVGTGAVPARGSWWWRWGLPLGFFVAVALVVGWLHRDPLGGASGVPPRTTASFEIVDPAAPAPAPGTVDVALPHVWSESERDARRGRYTIRFDRGAVPDSRSASSSAMLP